MAAFPEETKLGSTAASEPVRVIGLVPREPRRPERAKTMAAAVAFYGLRDAGQALRGGRPVRIYVRDLSAFAAGEPVVEAQRRPAR